ncbi:MAG: respiratory nitrate reductase subunit gamma [Vicinamibacterales bacterium]|jgi:nitrate reductase gamma subunit|nr:respiratory nitrate reductase subunit gamma [Vicinamibacterales bacterium]
MTGAQGYLDPLLLVILPYVAAVIFFLVTIERYRTQSFSYSSLSSQFLENQQHFWGLVPFHFGILAVIGGHIAAFVLPAQVLAWNGEPLRLYVLEVTALIFGLLSVVGLLAIIYRRLHDPKIQLVTNTADWIIYALLLVQLGTGVLVAIFYPWGSSWFAAAATPYLWSLIQLNPDLSYVTAMPWLVKAHIVNAYLVIGFFPFSRLVHVLVVPNPYLWRKPQVVRWYRRSERTAS